MIPDAYYKNIFAIDYKRLKELGIKNLFFDIDNTVIPYFEKEISKETKSLFNNLKNDFCVFLFSNSRKKRVYSIANELGVDSYYSSMKPLKRNYKKIMNMFKKNECVFIGDQFMTDVLGAKRNGLKVIFVNKLKDKEPITTKFWRILEKHYLKKYKKYGLFNIDEFYDRIKTI